MTFFIGRVSTLQISRFGQGAVQRTSTRLERAGVEVSTGRRADIFRDLGPRAASDLALRARENLVQTHITSNKVLENKLQAMLDAVEVVRESASSVLGGALANLKQPMTSVEALRMEARSAIEAVTAALNTTFGGESLFSGTASGVTALTAWSEVNPSTGVSPEMVVQSIVSTPPASVAEAQSMIADLDAVFDSSYSADPAKNFEATFFNGTPQFDSLGNPMPRVLAQIEPGRTLGYGVQANDTAFREILKGLAMLASVDVSQITDPEAYATWMDAAASAISEGSDLALSVSAEIGFNQQTVSDALDRLEAISMVQKDQIAAYENVDPYEAATRLNSLKTQLEASYSVSAQLARLTILNYL